ncbi:hypothetical protein ScPMuIL_017433 [Solemya velum]
MNNNNLAKILAVSLVIASMVPGSFCRNKQSIFRDITGKSRDAIRDWWWAFLLLPDTIMRKTDIGGKRIGQTMTVAAN